MSVCLLPLPAKFLVWSTPAVSTSLPPFFQLIPPGFYPYHSTEKALINQNNHWATSHQTQTFAVTCLGLTRAYDTMVTTQLPLSWKVFFFTLLWHHICIFHPISVATTPHSPSPPAPSSTKPLNVWDLSLVPLFFSSCLPFLSDLIQSRGFKYYLYAEPFHIWIL